MKTLFQTYTPDCLCQSVKTSLITYSHTIVIFLCSALFGMIFSTYPLVSDIFFILTVTDGRSP